MSRTQRLAGAALVALLFGPATPEARADGSLYRYVDARGVVHFTNRPTDRRFQRVASRPGMRRSVGRRPSAYDGLIARAAHQHGVPAALVKAVIHAESAFDPRAISRKGAMGLMQLMPDTARALGVRQPFQAEQNVFGGTRYLRELHDRYGSWAFTLAAYNAGPSAVDRYRGIPPYAETQGYVSKVLSYYRRYHGDFTR